MKDASIPMLATVAMLREILLAAKPAFPEAVIAGGCVRDMQFGIPFKDIDIFVPVTSGMDLLIKLMDLPADFERKRVLNFDYMTRIKGKDETLRCVVTYAWGDYEVQFIGVTLDEFTPEAVMDRIDFGLCRIAFKLSGDGEGHDIVTTPEFLFDKQQRTMSLLRCDNPAQLHQSLRRYQRLSRKFPGYAFRAAASAQRDPSAVVSVMVPDTDTATLDEIMGMCERGG